MKQGHKYRIIEETFTKGVTTHVQYAVEKRFLWFWVRAKIPVTKHWSGSYTSIQKERAVTSDLEAARMFVDYLQSPFRQKYKGCVIVGVFDRTYSGFRLVYINKSDSKYERVWGAMYLRFKRFGDHLSYIDSQEESIQRRVLTNKP